MGMSSLEWSQYLHERLGVDRAPEHIVDEVAAQMAAELRRSLPLVSGAVEVVHELARRWPLGLASSSNRALIDLVLEQAHLQQHFDATVSSEEVDRGKPAPDVYLEAARRLDVDHQACVVVEDSENGILAGLAAGMHVVAIPNRDFPPDPQVLERAHVVLDSLRQLGPSVVEKAAARTPT